MLAKGTLTPRQQREQDYYNQFSRQTQQHPRPADLGPIAGHEQRPWNPYWHLFALIKDRYRPDARLLDFGCGWGDNTAIFAHIGYQVEGFDISEGNIDIARRRAEKEGLGKQTNFTVQSAEGLNYPDEHFDIVAGVDILHHVDIASAMVECRRVLRDGGTAFFIEPLRNPLFDGVRNTRLIRRFWPNEASIERHITADERKLTDKDLKFIGRVFPRHRVDRFHMLARLAVFVRGGAMTLEKLDYSCRVLPFYGRLAGYVVLTLDK